MTRFTKACLVIALAAPSALAVTAFSPRPLRADVEPGKSCADLGCDTGRFNCNIIIHSDGSPATICSKSQD